MAAYVPLSSGVSTPLAGVGRTPLLLHSHRRKTCFCSGITDFLDALYMLSICVLYTFGRDGLHTLLPSFIAFRFALRPR